MVKIKIPALDKEIEVERIMGSAIGSGQSPTVIFIAGIHGNETSGVYALQKVMKTIQKQNLPVKGSIYALCGNINALGKGLRYEHVDLNRIWTQRNIKYIQNNHNGYSNETREQLAIFDLVKSILKESRGPFLFLDLHSTSAYTNPFITISDSINNRKFSSKYPVPVVLGIEEYLDGPFLSFINEFGHIALGFEAGQHNDIQAIKCSEAFIWLTLHNTGCLQKKNIKAYKNCKKLLSDLSPLKGTFFEIDHRYHIEDEDRFKMQPDFLNFDQIRKGQLLAQIRKKPVYAPFTGYIFMPLYQDQGDDGFFIVTKISKFWLFLSKFLRKIHFHHVLKILPGIRQYSGNKHTLIVNRKTAKFLAVEIFHLFGYRKKVHKGGQWLFIKRDRKVSSL